MKTKFTRGYMLSNRGCYSGEKMKSQSFMKNEEFSIFELIDNLPIKDFNWFFFRKCDLSLDQKKELSLLYAEFCVPIYESKYPEDNRISDCIEAIKMFNNNEINLKELKAKQHAAYAAAAAAAAAYAAYAADAYAASAAAYAADAAADAADASATSAADAATSAAAAAAASYAAKKLEEYKRLIKDWITKNS